MMLFKTHQLRYRFWVGLSLWLCVSACGSPEPGSPKKADALQAASEAPILPVMLPALDALPDPAREQIQLQETRVRTLEGDETASVAERGAAYGYFGQLLLAYDFYPAAEPALTNAENLLPEDGRWPYYLGYLHQKTGAMNAAARAYTRALDVQPDNLPARIHLAEVYRDLGQEAQARDLLEETVHRDPTAAAAHYLLGQLADPDAPATAVAHYEATLRLQPGASIVHYPLGLAYRKQGDEERSRQHLARRGDTKVALPDSLRQALLDLQVGADAALSRGSTLMARGRVEEALAAFEQATAAAPDNATAFLNLGAAHARLGHTAAAIDALEKALLLNPLDSKAQYNLAVLLAGQNDRSGAIARLRAALDADSSNVRAHFALAQFYMSQDQCQEAVSHFEAFLATTPQHHEARINTAMCYARVGNYAAARDLLEAGYTAYPTHPGLQDALVRILSASEDTKVRDGARALGIAQSLVATMRRPETLSSLAMALAETGRYPEAIERQQEALRIARQGGQSDFVPFLQKELRRYEQSLPSRTPWPDFMFPTPPTS